MKQNLSLLIIFVFFICSFYLNYQPISLGAFKQNEIRFTITGEVMNPGTYIANESTLTLEQAILMAGGVNADAQEVLPLEKNIQYDEYIIIPKHEGEHRISINYATVDEIIEIPGIGPAMAKRIIEYRKEYGLFHRLEDLMDIKGIKQKLFEKMLPYITI